MRYIKFLFVAIVLFVTTAGRVSAADKCEPELYMFGYAFSFNDSTLYITTIQKVENVWLRSRNNFVIERETYSHQLQQYFEKDNVMNMTCGVSFHKKHKKLLKKYNKLKARYEKRMKHVRIITLSDADFAFTSVVPLQIENPEKEIAENKDKKSRKQRKADKKKK